ncbi:carboxymuconolactone decarboxylase family protein [Nonomuraea cavernae]|uniref:4-carboxymuconolactone decarboxylase n=2 Tax=Nonomuraea cavernae TaxID=2045107 RepID=A0A917ZAF0_9ACTN|nr:carboxymuconolactone decarboxylase family protein [Nonomuraea cavernae]GGO79598.1 putative 4-carboxymuconolactone decarboxylase [Nonomuraea cavernae]
MTDLGREGQPEMTDLGREGQPEMTDLGREGQPEMTDERRRRGLDMMRQVYGWELDDAPGDFFGITADHLFADIWTRPGLSLRDRRLLLIGVLAGRGLNDVLDIQLPAALGNGELTPDELREIAIFLTHYVGWPLGARLSVQIDTLIARHERGRPRDSP